MKESLIYPGEYIPLPAMETRTPCVSSDTEQRKLLLNMYDTGDTIRIEVALPGRSRDHIAIYTRYNILTILVAADVVTKGPEKHDVVHEFDKGYMERRIALPEDADTEFMSAEFKKGVLKLYMLKTGANFATDERQVVVY